MAAAHGLDLAERLARRLFEYDHRLGDADRQALAGADEDRHALPAPAIDGKPGGGIGLNRRTRFHAGHILIAFVLTAHEVAGLERAHGLEQARLAVADCLALLAGGRVHGERRQDLQHMVLQHVADGARLVVERAAVLHAETFRHGDLDAAHIGAVPDRLVDRVGEARVEDVLHRLLAEIMVDAEDVLFGEILVEDARERIRRRPVAAERLLDHEPRVLGAARLGEL